MRALTHYLIGSVLLYYFGLESCTYICGLNPTKWMTLLAVVMVAGFAIRFCLQRILINRAPLLRQSCLQFALEIVVLMACAISILIYNYAVYGFPLGSGLKVFFASTGIGFFVAADQYLARERAVARIFNHGQHVPIIRGRFLSMPAKLAAVATAAAILSMGTLLLLVYTNLQELGSLQNVPETLERARQHIQWILQVVCLVVLGYVLNLIVSFSRNLKMYLKNQTTALQEVARGQLDGYVAFSTGDELGQIAKYTNTMITQLRQRTDEVQRTQDATLVALTSLAETRDNETGKHILRTQSYVRILAQELAATPHPARPEADTALLEPERLNLLVKSAPLHDIGKVGIPDAILLKPGKLSTDEFTVMKTHTSLGCNAIRHAQSLTGESSYLSLAAEIANSHHEKWDGSGYPQGLAGAAIPLCGRIMALADVYDALTTKRVYKEAFSHEKAKGIILEGKGTHFDPAIIDAFLAREAEFIQVATTLADTGDDIGPEKKNATGEETQ